MAPAMAKISGGTDSTAKKAASPASPVTRCRMQEPTVVTISRQSRCPARRDQLDTRVQTASSTVSAVGMGLR